MSELIIDDDPDPFSGSINGYRINLETGKAYDGYELTQYYRELVAKDHEKRAVGHLSMVADRIFREYKAEGVEGDQTVCNETGSIRLRRHRMERLEDGRTIRWSLYFYVDDTRETSYCRSWWSEGYSVNWCAEEKLHEPAVDVEERLEAAFPSPHEQPTVKRRHFGSRVLTRVMSL